MYNLSNNSQKLYPFSNKNWWATFWLLICRFLHKVSHNYCWLDKVNFIQHDIEVCKYDDKALNAPMISSHTKVHSMLLLLLLLLLCSTSSIVGNGSRETVCEESNTWSIRTVNSNLTLQEQWKSSKVNKSNYRFLRIALLQWTNGLIRGNVTSLENLVISFCLK